MPPGGVGVWVLLAPALRPLFVLATRRWTWIAKPLPPLWRRKLGCVAATALLILAITPLAGPELASAFGFATLVVLLASFGSDLVWLHRQRLACS